MDPVIGYVLLAAGVLLYVALVVRLMQSPRGDLKGVRARDVSGQVVVADRLEGGVTQHQVQPAPGLPEAKTPGKVRQAFDWIKLLLGIVATILSIAGAALAFWGSS